MYEVDGRLIRAQMFNRAWNISNLVRATTLHERTCRKLIDGGKVTMKVIATVAKVFNVESESLILKSAAQIKEE